MNIDTWTGTFKVRAFPWIDGKNIYFNVQTFRPGAREADPKTDKSVLIHDDDNARHVLSVYLNTLASAVSQMPRTGTDVVVTCPKML